MTMKKNKVIEFITTTLSGMANGLFATLIIGTIFSTIGSLFGVWSDIPFFDFLASAFGTNTKSEGISSVLKILTGAGIGVGIALSLKLDTFKTIIIGSVGEIAAYFSMGSDKSTQLPIVSNGLKVGDPLTIYVVCVATALLMKLIFKKKTSIDILLIPLFGCTIGLLASLGLRYPSAYITYGIQWVISAGTTAVPFLMGIIVAVLMGMALTAPISSAAIASMIFTGNLPGLALASGAAVVGCSTQMVGIAIQSRKDNNIGQVFSIGIGTSMLQFSNIIKKPIIWLPSIITSAILGPISTCLIKLECLGSSAGMGTAGFVGQIGTFSSMGNTWQTWVGIFVLEIIAPIIITFAIDLLFRKFHLINNGDFALENSNIN